MAFDIKREFSLLPNKYFTYDQIKAELNDIVWKCRRDLPPGFYARDLFELGLDQGYIRAGQGDEYLVNVRRSYAVSSSTVATQQSQPMGVGGHINLSGNVVGVLNSTGRGSGRTTRQMQALPQGGWFFHNSSQEHMEHVRKQINRPDIVLHSINVLLDISRFRGESIPGLLMDHAVKNVADIIMIGYIDLLNQVHSHTKITIPVQRSTICPCGIHRLDCDYHK